MENKKQYIIDTNVLLEDPEALFKLRNGNENSVFIPYHVLLKPFRRYEFFIYHRLNRAENSGSIHLRPYSRTGFLDDLIECHGVISNAGFELASEALYLGKKILVKPLAGQMEQISNVLAIATLKLGMVMSQLSQVCVAQFLDRPAGRPIKFPNLARMAANWIEGGQWEDVEGLAQRAWQQTALPV